MNDIVANVGLQIRRFATSGLQIPDEQQTPAMTETYLTCKPESHATKLMHTNDQSTIF